MTGPTAYNVNINQQNTGNITSTPQFSVNIPPPYVEGIVERIITNEESDGYGENGANVGMAYIRLIPGDRYREEGTLLLAQPANPFITSYPLKNEMVHVRMCGGRPCYDVPLNLTNKVNEQTYPGLRFGPPILGQDRTEAAQRSTAGIEPYTTEDLQKQQSFGNRLRKFNPFAKKLRAEEGDIIIQGRFGNAIRFGSSLTRHPTKNPPEPNVLITAGQWPSAPTSTKTLTAHSLTFENINDDKSSIWLVADQEVDFYASTEHEELPSELRAHLRSSDTHPDRPQPMYMGAQIFITSDRVVVNSKKNSISLFSKSEINLSARKSITLDSEKTIYLNANDDVKIKAGGKLLFEANSLSIITLQDLAYGTAGEYTIVGKNVFIGKRDKTQPMVLGASLAVWLQNLLDAFIIQFPLSISTLNPTPFVNAIGLLRAELGLTPLDAAGAVFNSKDNFVARKNTGSDILQAGVPT